MPNKPAATAIGQAAVTQLNIAMPASLDTVQNRILAPTSQQALAQALAPTIQHMVSAAGIQLPAAQLAALQQAFVARGSINISPSADDGATVSVEATSLNCTSRGMQQAVSQIQ